MKAKPWGYIGAILFAAVLNNTIVSLLLFIVLVFPPLLKFAGTILDGHAHPGKYSEYSDK